MQEAFHLSERRVCRAIEQPRSSQRYAMQTANQDNISAITDNLAAQTQNYTYDAINRLTQVSGAVSENYSYDPQGRLSTKSGQGTYAYAATQPASGCQGSSGNPIFHAVSAVTGKSFSYDCNGNMIGRTISGTTYTLGYDAEGRMVSASWGANTNNYVYDGNGVRVKSVVGGVTTVFIGGYFEWNNSGLITKYYGLGASVSAMRREGTGITLGLFWMLGDHLGSASVILMADGNPQESTKYTPWGGLRTGSVQLTLTMKGFTGQYRDSYINLVWMNSRWYDPELGRWTQPDVIVPANQGVQGFDRYGYVSNSPVNWIDPSGHGRESTDCGPDGVFCDHDKSNDLDYLPELVNLNSGGSGLLKLSISINIPINDIIEFGLSKELAGWISDPSKVKDFIQMVLNRYVWYARNNCNGNIYSVNCAMNFFMTYDSVILLVDTFMNDGPGYDVEFLFANQQALAAIGGFMDDFWNNINPYFDPDNNPSDRNSPFGLGVYPKTSIDSALGHMPVEGVDFVISSPATCSQSRDSAYSLMVTWTQSKLLNKIDVCDKK